MALMLNKTRVFRSTMPGDDTIIESIIRYPKPEEETAFLSARSEIETKDGKTLPAEANLRARVALYDAIVLDIRGKYLDGEEEKEFSYDNPPPIEWLSEFCESKSRVMSDKEKGWQLKDAIPDIYKHFCIMSMIENMHSIDAKTKKK